MDPIEWLRSLFREPTIQEQRDKAITKQTPDWLQQLYKSPVADSLYQIAGVPSSLGAFPAQKKLGQEYGYYDFGFDALSLNADKSKYKESQFEDVRNTLIHEMGHKSTARMPTAPFKPTNQLAFPDSYYQRNTPQGKASLALDRYYTKSPLEAQAQAFVNAFNFLAETARDPKIDFRKFAGDLEANTPGMGLIVQDLMKLPIFAKHPLQGQMFREAPNKKEKK